VRCGHACVEPHCELHRVVTGRCILNYAPSRAPPPTAAAPRCEYLFNSTRSPEQERALARLDLLELARQLADFQFGPAHGAAPRHNNGSREGIRRDGNGNEVPAISGQLVIGELSQLPVSALAVRTASGALAPGAVVRTQQPGPRVGNEAQSEPRCGQGARARTCAGPRSCPRGSARGCRTARLRDQPRRWRLCARSALRRAPSAAQP
jgi:hypothetical protein